MCGQWRLDQQDLDTYRSDGLVKSPFRIPDEQLGRMRESLDRLLRDDAHITRETLVCPRIPYGKTHDEAAATISLSATARTMRWCPGFRTKRVASRSDCDSR